MANERFRVEPLSGKHDRSSFTCGDDALDRYLKQQAGQDIRRRLAVVFVLIDIVDGAMAGFYTLSSTSIRTEDLPSEVSRRLGRYPAIPAVLLGRLAIAVSYQRRGLGAVLLVDALQRGLAHSEQVAAMAVVVDAANDEARNFYERYGFRRFLDDPYRLFIPMDSVTSL